MDTHNAFSLFKTIKIINLIVKILMELFRLQVLFTSVFTIWLCTEEGTLNATETAVCNLFQNLFGALNVDFSPIITSVKFRLT